MLKGDSSLEDKPIKNSRIVGDFARSMRLRAGLGLSRPREALISLWKRSHGKPSFPLPAHYAAPAFGVKPASAAAIPEAGVWMAATISCEWPRSVPHRSLRDERLIMPAVTGNIDAGNAVWPLKMIHAFPIFMDFELFLNGSDA